MANGSIRAILFMALAALATMPTQAAAGTNFVPMPVVLVKPGAITVDEGGSGQLAVALGKRPWKDVVIGVAADSTGCVTADRTRLVFTPANWNRPQPVTISAHRDADAVDDVATVTFIASRPPGAGVESTTATV